MRVRHRLDGLNEWQQKRVGLLHHLLAQKMGLFQHTHAQDVQERTSMAAKHCSSLQDTVLLYRNPAPVATVSSLYTLRAAIEVFSILVLVPASPATSAHACTGGTLPGGRSRWPHPPNDGPCVQPWSPGQGQPRPLQEELREPRSTRKGIHLPRTGIVVETPFSKIAICVSLHSRCSRPGPIAQAVLQPLWTRLSFNSSRGWLDSSISAPLPSSSIPLSPSVLTLRNKPPGLTPSEAKFCLSTSSTSRSSILRR